MVSLLGDYSYTFPRPIPLKLKLKDMLEDNVDEKYYLSDKQIKNIQSWNAYEKPLENMERTDKSNISPTLTTRSGAYATGMILIKNNTKQGYLEATYGDGIDLSQPSSETRRGRVQKQAIQTLTTQNNLGVCVGTYQYAKSDNFMQGKDRLQLGKETSDTLQTSPKEGVVLETLKKDLCNKLVSNGLVEEGDIVKHSYTTQILDGNKKCVEKNDGNMITLTTRGDCFGVTVKTIGNYTPSNHNAGRIVDQDYSAPTVMENHGTITAIVDKPKVLGGIGEKDSNNNTQWKQQNRIYDDNVSISVTTAFNPYYKSDLRIRKLTPRTCGRLMGVKDEDITNLLKNQSDSSAYHLFGDSIVVNVIEAIIKQMI